MQIGEVASFQNGYAFKSKDFVQDGKYKTIKIKELKNGKVRFFNDSVSVNVDDERIIEKYIVEKGDVLFALTGDPVNKNNPLSWVGRVSIYEDDQLALLNQRVCKLVPNEELNAKYIYYYFRAFNNFYALASIAKGSASQANISTKDIEAMEIDLPSLIIQNKIVSVLDSIEEKINQNNKINKNLEEQAQSIFANEFLSLATLPKGWKQASLIDIADYLNGLAMQKYRPTADESGIPVLKIKELRQGCCNDNSELCSPSIKSDYIIHDGDVIFSWSGSLLVDFWCGGTCGLNQHLFKVTSNIYDKWFYYSWTNYYLQKFAAIAADMATTMGHIKREELAKSRVLIPSNSDYERIGGLLAPLYDLVISNRIENSKLATIRDTLLPKLMTGELDVSNINL
ncbi:restriction endonuclease subunit S [Gardnerella pickettii]|uniref:restriction endonuclease subunit S n=1 Tax=Gardnerella TaxID=2701 RepID=UPI0039EDF02F